MIPHEELDAEGKGDKIAEEGSEVKEQDGGQGDEQGGFKSSFPEKGREGFPEMVENNRYREEEACKERQLEKGEKGFGNAVSDQIFLEGAMKMAEQFLCKRKEDDSEEDDRPDDMEEAFSQTAQRLEKFFSFDSHPDSFSATDTGCNVT